MKEITIYELLGLVKDGKAPKIIKYGVTIYEKIIEDDDGINYRVECGSMKLFDENFFRTKRLNDEIEILEEEKKIPKKLDIINGAVNGKWENGKSYNYTLSAPQTVIIHKVNEIIDYLKSKGE